MPTVSRAESRAARVARDGVLAAAALLCSYLETLLPVGQLLSLPGFRVGLANVIVTFVLFELSAWDAAGIAAVKTLLSAVLFGGSVSFAFSAAKAPRISPVAAGALFLFAALTAFFAQVAQTNTFSVLPPRTVSISNPAGRCPQT